MLKFFTAGNKKIVNLEFDENKLIEYLMSIRENSECLAESWDDDELSESPWVKDCATIDFVIGLINYGADVSKALDIACKSYCHAANCHRCPASTMCLEYSGTRAGAENLRNEYLSEARFS